MKVFIINSYSVAALLTLAWCVMPVRLYGGQDSVIQVTGYPDSTVSTMKYALGDIASVTTTGALNDEAVIALKKIELGKSPLVGTVAELPAESVLELMERSGVNMKQVRYSLPRIIKVRRAAREVTLNELFEFARAQLSKEGRDISVREIVHAAPILVPPSANRFDIKSFSTTQTDKVGFTLTATADKEEQTHAQFFALVDEWGMVPVAKRPLTKGAVVDESDVMMARLSIHGLPRDAARDEQSVIGLKTAAEVRNGDIFRIGDLSLPALVNKGSKVTLLYRQGNLEVTATGLAMEQGIKGQEIHVKNENSKKIIQGIVKDTGIVEVLP